ncbi:MAG: PP0621 family protein [Gammaproteobacteria bacterium]|nr:PP0621 family protein [Gammaproteobacteria bacterium]
MNLLRLIFIALVVWVLVALVRSYLRRAAAPKQPQRIGTIVRCAKCGLHVPQGEALLKDERYYCSASHRDARD